MAYSNQVVVSDGSLTTILLSIDFFDKTEISVYLDDALTTDYIWATSNSIQFVAPSTPVPNGVSVRVQRTTDISKMRHVFAEGAVFKNSTLDEDYEQILHIAQESIEGGHISGFFQNLDAHGNRIINLGDAVDPNDAVPLHQVEDLIDSSPEFQRTVRAPSTDPVIPALPSVAARASKVMGFDASGNPIAVLPASGSGTELAIDLADAVTVGKGAAMVGYLGMTVKAALDGAAKISDLANSVNPVLGATMVGYESGQSVRQKLDQMSEARVDLVSEYGLIYGDAGNAAKIQNALNTAPIASTLVFPSDWVITTTVPIVVSRLMNLDLGRCTIRGDFGGGDTSSDVLRVAVTDAGPSVGDARMMIIRGGRVFNNGGGNCAININPAGAVGLLPQFGLILTEGAWGGQNRAVRIGAVNIAGDTNFCTIMGNDLSCISSGAAAAIDIDGCADGHRVLNNLIHGFGTSVRVNVVAGAYQTHIANNGLVSRDGALLVANGARIMFLYNQCEQPLAGNVLVPKATLLIQGLSYISHGCIIYGNNFGGGGNVDYNIALYNAQGCIVDGNYFFPAAVKDIILGDGGGGLSAKYNTIGGGNWARGARSVLNAPCDSSRRLSIELQSNTHGNRGVWRSDMAYSNSWVSAGFEFMLDGYNVLHLEGAIDSGVATGGTIMATFPTGYAPKSICYLPVVNELGALGVISANSAGTLTVTTIPASPNQRVELGHCSYNVVFPAVYDPGA